MTVDVTSTTVAKILPVVNRLCSALRHPGFGVTELFIHHPSWKHPKIGFFDNDEALAETISQLNGRANIYVGVNPRPYDLVAELDYDVNAAPVSGKRAKKQDIEHLCGVLLDIDAVRADGINARDWPASEAEHWRAVQAGRCVIGELLYKDMPYVALDSGNGAQVVALFDPRVFGDLLPADLGKTVRRWAVEAIEPIVAAAGGAVLDPSTLRDVCRLMRFPGTLNIKAESSDDRPHRESKLLDIYTEPDSSKLSRLLVDLHQQASIPQETGEVTGPKSDPSTTRVFSAEAANDLQLKRVVADKLRIRGIPEGQGGLRHSAMLLMAYICRKEGMSRDTAQVRCRELNAKCLQPPIEDVDHQVESVYDDANGGWLIGSEGWSRLREWAGGESERQAKIELISVDDEPAWGAIPDLESYVPGIIADGTINYICAEPKAGKSLLGLDLSFALAQDRGDKWPHGVPEAETPVRLKKGARVAYIVVEDAKSLVKERRRQFLEAYGPTNDRLQLGFMKGSQIRLYDPGDQEELIGYVEAGFNVLVIDTLGSASGGKGDVSREEWSEEIEPFLLRLQSKGVTLILIEHMRKSSEFGGRWRGGGGAKIRKPDPNSLFGTVAKRALYASAIYLGDTPKKGQISFYVETKVSDRETFWVIERVGMDERPGWRHRYVAEVSEVQKELAERSKEEGERNCQAVLGELGKGPGTYRELAARLRMSQTTVQGHVKRAETAGRVDHTPRGREKVWHLTTELSTEQEQRLGG